MLSFSETFKQGCSFHGNPSKATLVLRRRNPTLFLWEITGRKGNVERLELLGIDPSILSTDHVDAQPLVSWTCEYDDTNLCFSTYTAKKHHTGFTRLYSSGFLVFTYTSHHISRPWNHGPASPKPKCRSKKSSPKQRGHHVKKPSPLELCHDLFSGDYWAITDWIGKRVTLVPKNETWNTFVSHPVCVVLGSATFGCFQKSWYPQIIHFNRVFHYKPSILGYPYFWKHPFQTNYFQLNVWWSGLSFWS